jgi:hypothetical protein
MVLGLDDIAYSQDLGMRSVKCEVSQDHAAKA